MRATLRSLHPRPGARTSPRAPARAHARARALGEEGYTLIEALVVILVMGILIAVSVPIVSTLVETTSRVNVTYANVDQQLWLATNLQRLVRAAVAPEPSRTAKTGVAPIPAFVNGSLTPTSMTFYSNLGTPNGPVKVIAKCTATRTRPTLCGSPTGTSRTSTFTVSMTKPEVTKTTGVTFCPQLTGTYTKQCRYTTTHTKRTIITVDHVRNGANTPPHPLFVFAYPTFTHSTKSITVCAIVGVTTRTTCHSSDKTTFNACTAGTSTQPFLHCIAGAMQTVTYDLQINAKSTSRYGGAQAEDDTGVFILSAASMQYQPSVG